MKFDYIYIYIFMARISRETFGKILAIILDSLKIENYRFYRY